MLLCALIFTLFPYTTLFRSHGQVGAGQVSRATQQLRQDSAKLFDRILRRFTSGQFFGVFLKDRKSTRLNSSHVAISYAVFCLKKKNNLLLISPLESLDTMNS